MDAHPRNTAKKSAAMLTLLRPFARLNLDIAFLVTAVIPACTTAYYAPQAYHTEPPRLLRRLHLLAPVTI
jgi:hypothetical protein